MPKSANLRLEIEEVKINNQQAFIKFKNGSFIKVVTANDNARGNRSNILIIDEFRMVDFTVIEKVLRKFNIAPRQPNYLTNPKYKHLAERNKTMLLSSAWYQSHWSWRTVKSYASALVDDNKKYFVCGLPYQLSMVEGLLDKDAVADEMCEDTFDEISWSMEMGCMWYGESSNAFFTYEDLDHARKIKTPFYHRSLTQAIGDKSLEIPTKSNGEIRILTADIAVMGGKKNDATAIFIIQLLPLPNGQYSRQVVFAETIDGGHTETQAVFIRRIFEEFDCDYIVMDTNGVGVGVYDALVKPLTDDETGMVYDAISCMNNAEMAMRCKDKTARKVIYSVKATAEFNTECAASLRDCIKRGKTKILCNENEADEELRKKKYYNKLNSSERIELLYPYIQTTLLINEMVNLEYEQKGTNIKIKELSGNRKDRYSSLSYGNYFANTLERKNNKQKMNSQTTQIFMFRKPEIYGRRK